MPAWPNGALCARARAADWIEDGNREGTSFMELQWFPGRTGAAAFPLTTCIHPVRRGRRRQPLLRRNDRSRALRLREIIDAELLAGPLFRSPGKTSRSSGWMPTSRPWWPKTPIAGRFARPHACWKNSTTAAAGAPHRPCVGGSPDWAAKGMLRRQRAPHRPRVGGSRDWAATGDAPPTKGSPPTPRRWKS
jgi:hypothetical protein